MPASTIRVLLIEDNLAEARLLQEILQVPKFKQFHLRHVKRLAEALAQLQQNHFDAILLDLTLPDSQGLASLPPLLHQAPSLPIVVLTNTNDDDLAIAAVRQGAEEYLVKRQVNAELLTRSLCY
ncbi:MAG TPA: response regulator, partial [Candidatus Obscuribacterales bacterium]